MPCAAWPESKRTKEGKLLEQIKFLDTTVHVPAVSFLFLTDSLIEVTQI